MQREIKLRGKRVDNGEWVYGYYFQGFTGISYILVMHDHILRMTEMYEVDPFTIGQYTGLTAYWYDFENEPQEHDIWEHDLLEIDSNNKKIVAEVKFENGMFILCSNMLADGYIPLFDVVVLEDNCWVDAKVVGNIFDNPKLLEVLE